MKLRFVKFLLLTGLAFSLSALNAQEALPQFLKHNVKSGETLSSIAAKYHVNKRDILLLNDFPSDKKVAEGDVVLIRTLTEKEANEMEKAIYAQPAKKTTREAEPEVEKSEPVKHSSETVTHTESTKRTTESEKPAPATLRTDRSTSVKQEKQTVKETAVVAAQKPAQVTAVTPAPAASTKAVEIGPHGTKYKVESSGYHTVERGQTFYRIALIYGLTVDELKELNGMNNTTIEIGQKLKVKK